MKVISIGRADYSIFQHSSEEARRIASYGECFEYLFVVVFANQRAGFSRIMIAENVEVIPTNSRWRFFYPIDAYLIAKRIFQTTSLNTTNFVITAQDPFEVGLIGCALKRRFGIPLQLQIHTDFLSPYFWRESFKNKIRVLLARFLIPRADGIRVVSERITNQLKTKNYKLKTDPVFLLTSNYEGYGRTVIEAAAAGCSVVMTDVGIAGEIIHNDESGIIVPVGNADAIATAISTLCRNTVLRTKFMSSGHYNIEKKVVKDKTHYVKLYCETLLRIV